VSHQPQRERCQLVGLAGAGVVLINNEHSCLINTASVPKPL